MINRLVSINYMGNDTGSAGSVIKLCPILIFATGNMTSSRTIPVTVVGRKGFKCIHWNQKRVIWIGFFQNAHNTQCLISRLPKDIIVYILSFLTSKHASVMPTKYKIKIEKDAEISVMDFKVKLSKVASIDATKLSLVHMRNHKINCYLDDDEPFPKGRFALFAYEMASTQDLIDNLIIGAPDKSENITFKCSISHKHLIRNNKGKSKYFATRNREDIGIPLALELPLGIIDCTKLYDYVYSVIEPYFNQTEFDKFQISTFDAVRKQRKMEILRQQQDKKVSTYFKTNVKSQISTEKENLPFSLTILNDNENGCALCGFLADCDGCDLFNYQTINCCQHFEFHPPRINIGIEWKHKALKCFNHNLFARPRTVKKTNDK